MTQPFFTIITSTLNSASTLERCLRSVAEQMTQDLEHLIVDGLSTDSTLSIVKRFENVYPLKLICSAPDTGIYQAWNRALECAEGAWILFMGSDDFLLSPEVLEGVKKMISAHVKGQQVETVPRFYSFDTLTDQGIEDASMGSILLSRLRGSTPFPTAVFISRCVFDLGARFDESYKICADHKFYLQHNFNRRSKHYQFPVYFFSTGGISSSSRKKFEHYLERKRMLCELGCSRPLITELYYYLRARYI
jgi:glycosyltransferase involved in cell wall biosynthesis